MNIYLNKEQKEIREEIIKFARASLNLPEEQNGFSSRLWQKSADFGLLGLNLPVEYGGMEQDYFTMAVALDALGYACTNNGFVFALNNHIWVCQQLICLFGARNIKEKYLKRMGQGELIGAVAITEADAGSDAHAMRTTATLYHDHYIINGTKMFISNATVADVFIVFAQDSTNGGLTAFAIERTFSGVTVGKDIAKMGLKGCPMAELSLIDCMVHKDNILGSTGAGQQILREALELERCYEFAPHVGAMQRIMEQCLKYVDEREQFGNKLSMFQSVTHKIADMKVAIEMARLMLYKVATLKDRKKSAYLDASIFKLHVSEAYIETCKNAMQIFGAYGYTEEYGLERELRDAMACSIYSGTSEIQRNTIYTLAQIDM